jgi:SAM-dependent methyltransferase
VRTARPIDPLRPNPRPGRYEDDVVVVGPGRLTDGVRTRHFTVAERGGRLHVAHRLPPGRIDDDLTGLLAAELCAPGLVTGAATVERIFTGVVLSSAPDPLSAWELFYRNTLRRLAAPPATGAIAGYAPVHARALALIPAGTTLDLGCCFGFLPLRLAARGDTRVIAGDVVPGTVRLLAAVASRLGTPLQTLAADAARMPLPDAAVDTVTAVHLLEHLPAEHGEAVLAEALRLARRRVIVAVPYEDEPDAAFGHVRTFDTAGLRRLGRSTGVRWRVDEHHGGWLVLDHR